MKNADLFSDFTATLAEPLLRETTYPWELLPRLNAFILAIGPLLSPDEYELREADVWVAKSAKLYPNIYIGGPAIIGPRTEVRPGAFVRGSALIGCGCVVGNSTELKNSVLFDNVQVPHYNYVGDSVLGFGSHLGAGSICSNVKSDRTNVIVRGPGGAFETGLRKLGAILGNHVDVGCNSVLCPGAVLMPHAIVYPLSRVRGVVLANHIYKDADHVVERR